MPLINIIIALILIGVGLWAINAYVPMDSKIKGILNALIVIVVLVWLLQVFGIMGDLTSIRVDK
jgi:hypothetical protein